MKNLKIPKIILQLGVSILTIFYIYDSWPKGNIFFEYYYYIFIWAGVGTASLYLINFISFLAIIPIIPLISLGEYLTENFKPWLFMNNYPEIATFWLSLITIPILYSLIEILFNIPSKKNKANYFSMLYSSFLTAVIYYLFSQETQSTITAWLFMVPFTYIIIFVNNLVKNSIITKQLVYKSKSNSYKKEYIKGGLYGAWKLFFSFYILVILPFYIYNHKDHLIKLLIDIIKLTSY